MSGPALAIVELSHIARGVIVTDAALKRAPVEVFASRPVSGGKHLVFMRGEVAVVEESMAAALERAGSSLLDRLLLTQVHEQVWSFLPDPVVAEEWSDESALIVDTSTVCACVQAADAAAKAAEVRLRDMRLAVGIAGRGFFTLTGDLHQVEAARDAAGLAAGERMTACELIARPAEEIAGRLVF